MEIYGIEGNSHSTPIHTILFDLDGTLIDSKEIIVKAAYQTAQHYQANIIRYQDLEHHFGMDLGQFLASNLSEKEGAKVMFTNEKAKQYMFSPLFPNVKNSLKQLREHSFQLGVVTNQQKDLAEKVLDHHGICELFDIIITKDDVKEPKPSPAPILLALERLPANPENSMMIGDTAFDSLAAQAAGIPCILLDYYDTHADPERIFQQLLDYLIPNTVR